MTEKTTLDDVIINGEEGGGNYNLINDGQLHHFDIMPRKYNCTFIIESRAAHVNESTNGHGINKSSSLLMLEFFFDS